MAAIPWEIVCVGLSLACAAAVAALGHTGRIPRYVAAPLTVAFLVAAGLSILFGGILFEWTYRIYLKTWPQAALPVLILSDSAALYFLLALWAGVSDAHWFWRLAAMFGALSALALVEAVEPLIMLVLGMVPVLMVGLLWKELQRRRKRLFESASTATPNSGGRRMRLRSAFLAFVIVGLIAVILRAVIHSNFFVRWGGLLLEVLTFVALGLTTATAAALKSKHRLWLVLLWCVTFAVAIHWHPRSVCDWAGWNHVIGQRIGFPELHGLTVLGLTTYCLVIGGISASAAAVHRFAGDVIWRRTASLALFSVALFLATPIVRIYYGLIPPANSKHALAAARPPASDESLTFERLTTVDWGLRPATESRPSDRFTRKLAIAATILKTPDRIWIDPIIYARRQLVNPYDYDFQTINTLFLHFDRAQRIAASEGKLDEVNEHAQAQARIVELLATSNLPLHAQGAESFQFWLMCNYLDLHECFSEAEILAVLEDSGAFIARRPSSLERHLASEELRRISETWRDRMSRGMVELATPRLVRDQPLPDKAEMLRRDHHYRASDEAFRIRLALALYRRRHQRWPDRLDEMTPDILQVVPADPFSKQSEDSILYRRMGDAYVLYSRGPDGIDHGGKFSKNHIETLLPGFDLDLQFDQSVYGNVFPWRKLPIPSSKSEPNLTLPPMASP